MLDIMLDPVQISPTSISECDHKSILEHVVVEVAVGGKSHDSPPTDRQRVEGLSSCILPHLYEKHKLSLNVMLLLFCSFFSTVTCTSSTLVRFDWEPM